MENSTPKPNVVLIDHYDSFSHILAQYFSKITSQMPTVLQHDKTSVEEIRALQPTHIVLSPGPGTPEKLADFAMGYKILTAFAGKLPVLGVCLGHQGIAAHYDAKIIHAPSVMHGKRSQITHNATGLFTGIPSPLTVMRYHSLTIDPTKLPNCLEVTATTNKPDEKVIMAIRHKELPIYGVQFHPESVGTEHGLKIIENFINLSSCEHLT